MGDVLVARAVTAAPTPVDKHDRPLVGDSADIAMYDLMETHGDVDFALHGP